MREAFAIEALVTAEQDTDLRALGGAVTLALCGAFEHPGPCPLAPHRTTTERQDQEVAVRVVAACERDRRTEVVQRIEDALASGSVLDPDGVPQRWRFGTSRLTGLRDDERDLADRLAASA
jgi:hypothetical protein